MSELVIIVQASIEPTIPDRYGQKERFLSKFELLKQERNRMRDEMLQQEEKTSEVIDPINPDQEVEPKEEKEEIEAETGPWVNEDPFATNKDSSIQEASEETQKTEDNTPTPGSTILDPEIKTPAIPLDFSDNDDNTDTTGAKTEVDDNQAQQPEFTEQPGQTEPDKTKPGQTESFNSDESDGNEQVTAPASYRYFVIGGSFRNEENAQTLNDQLIAEGFDAQILSRPDSDLYMVAYRGYNDLEKAKTAVEDIREYKNANAWLYKVK